LDKFKFSDFIVNFHDFGTVFDLCANNLFFYKINKFHFSPKKIWTKNGLIGNSKIQLAPIYRGKKLSSNQIAPFSKQSQFELFETKIIKYQKKVEIPENEILEEKI